MTDLEGLNLTGPVTLGVGWRHGSGLEGGRIETTQEVAALFRTIAGDHRSNLGSREGKLYSPEADLTPAEEYLMVDRGSLRINEPLLALLDNLPDRDALDPDDLPSRSLLFHAYIFPGQATFLRKTNPHLTARVGRFLTRLAETLSRVDEPVFAFDDRVDLVVTNETIFISNLNAFELLFKEDDFLVQHIPRWVDMISAHLPLNDEAPRVLLEHCRRNTRLRRRLETIHARGHLQKVSIQQVRTEAAEQGLDIATLVVDGKLNFDDATADDLLRLLNEDLLIGGLSGERFTVERKTPR